MERKNQKEMVMAVIPVLPPSAIPDADSTKGVQAEICQDSGKYISQDAFLHEYGD